MYPQILQIWLRGRQALAVGAHNLFQNNGKRNLFSKNWSDNDATRFVQCFWFAHVRDKMTKTSTADLKKCASKLYFQNSSRAIYITQTSIGLGQNCQRWGNLFNQRPMGHNANLSEQL